MENKPNHRSDLWVVLAVAAFFLTALPALFAWSAERILFNPAEYKQALAAEHADEQLPGMLGEMITHGGNVFLFGSGSQLMDVLQRSNYNATLRQIFPQSWVRAQLDSLVDQFWAYFNFRSPKFALLVDLRPVKERLTGPEAPRIAANIVAGFPPCTGDEILNFGLGALSGSVERLPLCKPPDALAGAANLLAEGSLRAAASAMPAQFDLASTPRLAANLKPLSTTWARGFAFYRLLRLVGPWLPWAALIFFLLTAALAHRTARGLLYWLGLAALMTGGVACVIALLLGLGVGQFAPWAVARLFGSDLVAFDLLVGTLARVTGRFMLISGLIAAWLALMGGALLAGDWWSRRKRVGEV